MTVVMGEAVTDFTPNFGPMLLLSKGRWLTLRLAFFLSGVIEVHHLFRTFLVSIITLILYSEPVPANI